MKRIILGISASLAVGAALCAGPAVGDQISLPPSPQRQVAQEWISYMNDRNLRGACEMQTEGQAKGLSAVGEPCGALPTSGKRPACPKASPGAKPPYRKSEIRAAAEQIGEYTEESATRGFVRIDAQVKASKAWGTLGLEQIAGSWRITYLRYGGETFAPAGNVFQTSPAFNKLWISNWCLTNHPRWEKKR
jgi:hypothetical protein